MFGNKEETDNRTAVVEVVKDRERDLELSTIFVDPPRNGQLCSYDKGEPCLVTTQTERQPYCRRGGWAMCPSTVRFLQPSPEI